MQRIDNYNIINIVEFLKFLLSRITSKFQNNPKFFKQLDLKGFLNLKLENIYINNIKN